MSYLNCMGNKLKPKEVNDTLESLTNSIPTPEPIEISADDVEYDNTTSQLSATNVQSAIDELFSNQSAIIAIYTWDAETHPVIENNGTVDITTDIYNIIATGKYLLQATLTTSISNGTSSRSNVICTLSQYGVILDRTSPKLGMFRLSLDSNNTKILFTTYGENTFYLGSLKLIKL